MNKNANQAHGLVTSKCHGALGVWDLQTGFPYVSLVNYSAGERGWPLFLFSTLARHTKALMADPRASLLVCDDVQKGDALAGFRITIIGTVQQIQSLDAKSMYLSTHPYAANYATFADFGFWQLVPQSVHLIGGFGRIETLPASDVF